MSALVIETRRRSTEQIADTLTDLLEEKRMTSRDLERVLNDYQEAGVVERDEDGAWFLTPESLASAWALELGRLKIEFEEAS